MTSVWKLLINKEIDNIGMSEDAAHRKRRWQKVVGKA